MTVTPGFFDGYPIQSEPQEHSASVSTPVYIAGASSVVADYV